MALDVGAGDGSLCSPYAHLFRTVAVTELTAPLCWRLKATETAGAQLETYATAELTPSHLGERFRPRLGVRPKEHLTRMQPSRALLAPQAAEPRSTWPSASTCSTGARTRCAWCRSSTRSCPTAAGSS